LANKTSELWLGVIKSKTERFKYLLEEEYSLLLFSRFRSS